MRRPTYHALGCRFWPAAFSGQLIFELQTLADRHVSTAPRPYFWDAAGRHAPTPRAWEQAGTRGLVAARELGRGADEGSALVEMPDGARLRVALGALQRLPAGDWGALLF